MRPEIRKAFDESLERNEPAYRHLDVPKGNDTEGLSPKGRKIVDALREFRDMLWKKPQAPAAPKSPDHDPDR